MASPKKPHELRPSMLPHKWKKGESGNPRGRIDIVPRLVKRMLEENSVAAAQTLCDIVQNRKTPAKIRVRAAEAILDRVYGKPKMPIDLVVSGKGKPLVVRFQGTLPEKPAPAVTETKAVAVTAPAEPRSGELRPGMPGNPGGRRKYSPEVKKALIEGSLLAAETLCEFINDSDAPPDVRARAAQAVLDRLYGQAPQPIYATAGFEGPVEIEFEGVLAEWAK